MRAPASGRGKIIIYHNRFKGLNQHLFDFIKNMCSVVCLTVKLTVQQLDQSESNFLLKKKVFQSFCLCRYTSYKL